MTCNKRPVWAQNAAANVRRSWPKVIKISDLAISGLLATDQKIMSSGLFKCREEGILGYSVCGKESSQGELRRRFKSMPNVHYGELCIAHQRTSAPRDGLSRAPCRPAKRSE